MAKFRKILVLISSLILIADAQILLPEKEKTAQFRVYIQDVLSGPNATVCEVARANITSTSTTSFGLVRVADSLITAGPDADSEKLGRARGILTNSGLEEAAVAMNFNFVFTAGEYKGSALSVVGWKLTSNINQELPIVGGTSIFRMARGYTISNTYSYDSATNHFVLIYDIYVVYIEQES